MSINAIIQVTSGQMSSAHVVNQLEINLVDAPNFKARVNHYPTADQILTGSLNWQSVHMVPYEALLLDPNNPLASVEKYLIAETEQYAEGVHVQEGAVETLEGARTRAIEAINGVYSAKVGALVEGYPKSEQASWPQQVEEAKGLESNPDYNAILLKACAAERGLGETAEDLAQKVLALNNPYREAYGTLTGIRQRLEKQIQVEEDIEVVKTITWPSDSPVPAEE